MNEVSSPVGQTAADEISLPALELLKTEQIFTVDRSINFVSTAEVLHVAPLVRRIVRRNLRNSTHSQAAEDVEQTVLLAIWQWRARNADRKLTNTEIEKIAARSAKRAALAVYRQDMRNPTDPQVDFDTVKIDETVSPGKNVSLAGETQTEVRSLGKFLFRVIERLSPRQRFALLLQKSDLIAHLLASEACRARDIARSLDLSRRELAAAIRQMPLSDERIGELWREKTGERLTGKQVREARCKARRNIEQALE